MIRCKYIIKKGTLTNGNFAKKHTIYFYWASSIIVIYYNWFLFRKHISESHFVSLTINYGYLLKYIRILIVPLYNIRLIDMTLV